jgi:phosphonate transport system substrate-binding protein
LAGQWRCALSTLAIMVTHPDSGIKSPADLIGRAFAFGDKGSTSGYLIPFHYFQKQVIDPGAYFSKVLYTKHSPRCSRRVTC